VRWRLCRIFTDFSVGDAASISIRDPFLMKPSAAEIVRARSSTYPLELARHLASEVVMTFNSRRWI
jgi:hypothetical protein